MDGEVQTNTDESKRIEGNENLLVMTEEECLATIEKMGDMGNTQPITTARLADNSPRSNPKP